MDVRNVGDALIYLGALAAALTAIGIVVRVVVVRPLQKWIKEQIKPQLAEVHAEVTPNHGGSIKDQVTRIDQRLTDHLSNHPGASS